MGISQTEIDDVARFAIEAPFCKLTAVHHASNKHEYYRCSRCFPFQSYSRDLCRHNAVPLTGSGITKKKIITLLCDCFA